eukprot:4949805-Amphidinium_carterae.1
MACSILFLEPKHRTQVTWKHAGALLVFIAQSCSLDLGPAEMAHSAGSSVDSQGQNSCSGGVCENTPLRCCGFK